MENFVSGILISNEPNAVYEGAVFNRYLVLQLDNGQTLVVFDPHCKSAKLVIGERYQVLVKPFIHNLHYIENEADLKSDEGLIFGRITNLSWTPPDISSNIYCTVDALRLFKDNNPFTLIETRYGTLIYPLALVERRAEMNRDEFKIGAFLQWEESRFDFVAALDPFA